MGLTLYLGKEHLVCERKIANSQIIEPFVN